MKGHKEQGQPYRLPNGSWTGLMGKLQAGDIDVFLGPFILPDDRTHYEFTVMPPMFYFRMSVLLSTKRPQLTSNFFSFLFQVDKVVWYLLILSCLILILTSAVADSFEDLSMRNVAGAFERYIYVYVAALFCEGSDKAANSRVSQLLLFTWLYFVIVMSNALVSKFMAVLTLSAEANVLRTMEELSQQNDLLIMTIKNSHAEFGLEESPIDAYQRIYKKMDANREKSLVSFSEFTSPAPYKKVKDGKAAMVTVKIWSEMILSQICFTLRGDRSLYFMEEDFFPANVVFLLNRDLPTYMQKTFHERCRRFVEAGLVDKLLGILIKNYWKCKVQDDGFQGDNTLKLKHLNSVFLLTLVCLLISVVVFVGEVINFKLKRSA